MIRKKLAMAMIIVLGIGCLLLSGCASALKVAMITGEVGKIAESRESRMTTEKSITTVEEYTIGENIVKIYSAGNNCIIRAFDNKGNLINRIYCKKSDLDMPPAEKIIYIYEFFKAIGTDLGPVELVTTATKPYTPTPNFDTQQTVLSNWGQPSETFVSPSGKVKIFTYNKEYKDHPIAVLAFIGQKLHKIIPMTPENYQGLQAKLTETQNFAALFEISE